MLRIWHPVTRTSYLRQQCQLPIHTLTGSHVLLQWRATLNLRHPRGNWDHEFFLYYPPQELSSMLMVTPKTAQMHLCAQLQTKWAKTSRDWNCLGTLWTSQKDKASQPDKTFGKRQRHKMSHASSKFTHIKMTTCSMFNSLYLISLSYLIMFSHTH